MSIFNAFSIISTDQGLQVKENATGHFLKDHRNEVLFSTKFKALNAAAIKSDDFFRDSALDKLGYSFKKNDDGTWVWQTYGKVGEHSESEGEARLLAWQSELQDTAHRLSVAVDAIKSMPITRQALIAHLSRQF